jgi:hypothetical protein
VPEQIQHQPIGESTMPPSGPRHPGEGREDRSGDGRPPRRGRRGRAVVAGTFLAALAIVLGVLLLVPRCGAAVEQNGSAVDRAPVAELGVEQTEGGGP